MLIGTENEIKCLGTKQMYTVLTGIPHPFGQYRSQWQLYSTREDTPLCQAMYFFGNDLQFYSVLNMA